MNAPSWIVEVLRETRATNTQLRTELEQVRLLYELREIELNDIRIKLEVLQGSCDRSLREIEFIKGSSTSMPRGREMARRSPLNSSLSSLSGQPESSASPSRASRTESSLSHAEPKQETPVLPPPGRARPKNGNKSRSLDWVEFAENGAVLPSDLVQIGDTAFLVPAGQSASSPTFPNLFSREKAEPAATDVVHPAQSREKKSLTMRLKLSPRVARSRRSPYGTVRSQSPSKQRNSRSPGPSIRLPSPPAPTGERQEPLSPRSLFLSKISATGSTGHRIENLRSLCASPELCKQDAVVPAQLCSVDPRAASASVGDLSECFLRLQEKPENMLAFFSSYQMFSDTETVLARFLEMTESALRVCSTQGILERVKRKQMSAYKRAVDFLSFIPLLLTTWISFDDRLAPHFPRILDFFQRCQEQHASPSIERLPELLATCMKQHEEVKESALLHQPLPEETGRFTARFLSLPPREAARCLHAAHLKLLRQVRPWHVIDSALHAGAAGEGSNPCAAVPFHFNAVAGWVSSIVLKREDLRKRADAVARWVQIARACWEQGFISALLMVTSALNSTPMVRLKHTWAAVGEATLREFRAFTDFCSPVGNYAPLREFVASHKGVVMPVAIATRDIVLMAEMMGLQRVEKGTIPYEACLSFGTLLTTPPIYHLLQEESDLQNVGLVQFLSNPVPRWSDERLYKISLQREPSEFRTNREE